jgi:hypothetical protein
MNRLRAYVVSALTALLLLVSVLPGVSSAATSSSADTGGSSALSINPRQNFAADPGDTINSKLTISNIDGQQPLFLSLRMRDFTFTDDSGVPKIYLADNAPQTPWSLKPFTALPKNIVTIPAGGSKTINYSLKIPKNQGGGSYYSAIQYASGAGSGSNVSLSASGVTLVFVNVSGKVNEHLDLTKLGAYIPNKSDAGGKFVFIATTQPKQISYSLKNSGNVAENPTGSIIVKNMFGHTVANIADANINKALALIGQTRRFDACMVTKKQDVNFTNQNTSTNVCGNIRLWPGRYSIQLSTFYGFNGNVTQEVSGSASFWYLPWWFLLLVAAIITYGVYKYKKIKRGLAARKRSKFRGRR